MGRVAVTVDNLAEAADLGRGRVPEPLAAGANPALDVGLPAMLDLLDRVGVSVTWFVEGWNGEHHPEAVVEVERRGHTVGAHGWLHEDWSSLSTEQEAPLLDRALAALGSATGRRPTAFRAPGGRRTPATLRLLADRGVELDASLAPDGSTTARPIRTPEGLIWLGFDWALVDATFWLWDDASPAAGADHMRSALSAPAAGPDDVAVLILHPHITGLDDGRVTAVEDLLAALVAEPSVELVDLASLSPAAPPPS